MALHTTLQIYGAAYDLLGVAVDAVKHMPRDAKPVLGSRIVDRCIEITTLIRRANREAATAIARASVEMRQRLYLAGTLVASLNRK